MNWDEIDKRRAELLGKLARGCMDAAERRELEGLQMVNNFRPSPQTSTNCEKAS